MIPRMAGKYSGGKSGMKSVAASTRLGKEMLFPTRFIAGVWGGGGGGVWNLE